MNRLAIPIFAVSFWLFLHLPLTRLSLLPHASTVFSWSADGTAFKNAHLPTVSFAWKEEPGRYSILRVSDKEVGNRVVVPPAGYDAIQKEQNGYVTFPDDLSFVTWFPQLGQSVHFFDVHGAPILSRPESRYLETSPDGRFFLAAAGDHSRMAFTNPDLKELASIEGLIFHQWKFAPQGFPAQAITASLDGQIALFHLDQNRRALLHAPDILKTMELSEEKILLHYRNPKNPQTDLLAVLSPQKAMQGRTFQASVEKGFTLPGSYVFSLPLGLSRHAMLAVVPAGEQGVLLIFQSSKKFRTYPLPQISSYEIESAHSVAFQDYLAVATEKQLLLLGDKGIFWSTPLDSPAISLKYKNGVLFIQTQNSLTGIHIEGAK